MAVTNQKKKHYYYIGLVEQEQQIYVAKIRREKKTRKESIVEILSDPYPTRQEALDYLREKGGHYDDRY